MYELYNGEEDLVEDLKLVRKTYADSMIHLNIIKPEVINDHRPTRGNQNIVKLIYV